MERLGRQRKDPRRGEQRLERPLRATRGTIVSRVGAAVMLALVGSTIHALLSAPRIAASAFPGENGKIVHSSSDGLTILDAGSPTNLSLTASLGGVTPDWSPDGRRIVFTSQDGRIHTIKADNSILLPLTGPGHAGPKWAPSGSQIVHTNSAGDLLVMNADGSGVHGLATHGQAIPGFSGHTLVAVATPNWSPDGTKIVTSARIAETSGETCNLWVLQLGTGGPPIWTRLTTGNPGGCDSYPSWSPDGSKVVFQRSAQLHTVIVASGAVDPLVIVGQSASPTWSPDGSKVLFLYDGGAGPDLYTVAATGGSPTAVTIDGPIQNEGAASWQRIQPQTITVSRSAPGNAVYGTSFTVQAVASSGLPVAYSSGSLTVCTNDGATFTMGTTAGTCIVQFDQEGDDAYRRAPQVTNQTIAVPSPIADLIVTLVNVNSISSPLSVPPGGSFQVMEAVRNQGSAQASGSSVRHYLSVDAVKGSGDVLLGGQFSVGKLGAGASASSQAITVTVPSGASAGTFFLLACADDTAKIVESDETNNCRAAAVQIQVQGTGGPLPDLRETAVGGPPSTIRRGAGFTTTDTVANLGSVPAAASTTRFYLSSDGVLDAGDLRLTGARAVGSLGPGVSSGGSASVTVPKNAAVGFYYLLGCADDTKVVAEAAENNNCIASANRVEITR